MEVDQGRSRNLIRLVVEVERRRLTQVPTSAPGATPNESSAVEVPLPRPSVSPPLPQVDVSPPAAAPEPEPETPEREPLRLVQPVPQSTERFVVQLGTDLQLLNAADVVLAADFDDQTLYVNEVTAGRQSWAELRLGFFESEEEAGLGLDGLIGDFWKYG